MRKHIITTLATLAAGGAFAVSPALADSGAIDLMPGAAEAPQQHAPLVSGPDSGAMDDAPVDPGLIEDPIEDNPGVLTPTKGNTGQKPKPKAEEGGDEKKQKDGGAPGGGAADNCKEWNGAFNYGLTFVDELLWAGQLDFGQLIGQFQVLERTKARAAADGCTVAPADTSSDK